MLQACVEIEAVISYGYIAKTAEHPIVREIFLRVMRDEAQHREYFISFAKALVESGVAPPKDVLAMAYAWVRPEVGETYGSARRVQTRRLGFVNWWEKVIASHDNPLVLWANKETEQWLRSRKVLSLLSAVRQITGLHVESTNDLERAYLSCLAEAAA